MSTLTKRIALPLLAIAVAGLEFAAVASAHSLSKSKAEKAAQRYGNKKVKDSDGDYVQRHGLRVRQEGPAPRRLQGRLPQREVAGGQAVQRRIE